MGYLHSVCKTSQTLGNRQNLIRIFMAGATKDAAISSRAMSKLRTKS